MLTWKSSNFSFFFGHWPKNFRSDSNIFLPSKRRFHSTYAEDFFGEHFLKKGVIYIHLLGIWARIVRRPARLLQWNCSKLLSTIPEEQCGCILFLRKYELLVFLGFEWENLQFHQKFFNRFVKTAFFVFRGTFSMRTFFYRIYGTILLIGLWVRNFRRLRKNFSAGL